MSIWNRDFRNGYDTYVFGKKTPESVNDDFQAGIEYARKERKECRRIWKMAEDRDRKNRDAIGLIDEHRRCACDIASIVRIDVSEVRRLANERGVKLPKFTIRGRKRK